MIRAALILALTLVQPAAAQDTETLLTARRAAQALSTAALALQEADGARDRVAALTQTVRAYEEGLTALREGLRRAAIREQTIELAFQAKREDIARLTGVLAGMQQSPGPLLLLHPAGPLGTARSGMMLADVTPALQAEAEILRAELQEVAVLRSLQEGAANTLADGLRGAQEARTALSQAIAERTDLPQRFSDDPEALVAILESADTLESFAAGLTAVPLMGANPDTPDFRSLQGALPLPVQGTLLRSFDEPDAAGVQRPGLVLATRPLALVTAPAAATVRYAGPLLDYGKVIVIEPAAGYLLVFAGLGEVYAEQNQVLTEGTPLGLMGGRTPDAAEFLGAVQQGGGIERTETLYIELRENAEPVDPGTWFALERG